MITELDVEAVKSAQVSGAVDTNNGGTPPPALPRFFPPADELKAKLQLTDAQIAQIAPIIEAATKDIGAVIATRKFSQIRRVRRAKTEAIRQLLTSAQLEPFAQLMANSPGQPPPPPTPAQQQDLAKRCREIFGVVMKLRAVISRVTCWGLRDAESWRRRASPLLFSDNFQRKPAYDAVINAAKPAGL